MTTVIRLPFDNPPLRSNDRHHWAVKAKMVKVIRLGAFSQAKCMGLKPLNGPVSVAFVWTVTDRRRRDAGASTPTLKAALDGIVDSGLLAGDHSAIVTAETCRIEVGTQRGCRVEIEEIAQ